MQDNQFLNVLGNQGSELNKELEDERLRDKEESLGFTNVRQVKSPFSQYNSFNYKLTEEEEKAQEQGYTQYAGGVVRSSDSPTSLQDTSFQSSKSLYERTLGVTQYDSLRSRLGLNDDESYTDYYNRTGYVPQGFEMEHRMLLAEEKRKQYFAKYQAGEIGEADFLFEAYGRDLMKADGHELTSSLYWYQRRQKGLTGSPLDNAAYMEDILTQAKKLYEAEEWFEKSQELTLGNSLANALAKGVYTTGETLDAITVRELFAEQFTELDQYYESTERLIDLYKAGYLSGFDPTIDINGDGKVDYYYHTDGKLYAIDGSSGVGSAKAYAYYNDDGSLNRITLTGSQAGEIGQQFIKGFTNILTDTLGFIPTLGGAFVDLFQGIFGNGWDFSATADAMIWWNKTLNENSFWTGNDGYILDSGWTTSDSKTNWMSIGRGAAAAVGTIAEIAGTVVLSTLTAGGYAGVKGAATVATKATTKIASKAAKKVVGKAVKEIGEEVAEKAIKEGIEELGEKVFKAGMTKVTNEAMEKVTKQAVKELGEEITEETFEKAVKKGMKEIIQETGEEGLEKVTRKVTKRVINEAGQETLEETSERVLTSSLNNLVEESSSQLFKSHSKQTIGSFVKQLPKNTVNSILKLQGVSNGTPMFTRTLWGNTLESISLIAVKDFVQTAGQLEMNKDRLGLTDGEILAKSFGVATLNAGISLAFRSVMDTTALGRWAQLAQKDVIKNGEASRRISKGFLNIVNGWQTNSYRSFMAANTVLDMFENMSTMYFSTSVAQTGEFFNQEAFKNMFNNPQMMLTQAFLAYQSTAGGFGKTNEGSGTGGIVSKLNNIQVITDDVLTYLKKAAQNATTPEDIEAINRVITDLSTKLKNRTDAQGKPIDPLTNMTDVLAELHTKMQDENGNSFVRDIITKAVDKRISYDTLAEMRVATDQYNASMKSYHKLMDDAFSGKLGKWFKGKRGYIEDAVNNTIKTYATKFDMSTLTAKVKLFESELYLRGDEQAQKINSIIEKDFELVSIDGAFKWDDKTNTWELTTDSVVKDEDTQKAILKYLNDGTMSIEELKNSHFLRLKGVGGTGEGSQDFKDAQEIISFIAKIAEYDQLHGEYNKRLVYALHEEGKNDLFLIPNLGFGLTQVNTHNIGEAIRALYILRYASNLSDRVEMFKTLPRLFTLAETSDATSLDSGTFLTQLYKNKLLNLNQLVGLIKEVEPDNVKNIHSDIINYEKGLNTVSELSAYANRKLSEADGKKVKTLWNDFMKLDAKIRDALVEDNQISADDLQSLREYIVNPNQSQEHYQKELKKHLDSLVENPTEDEIKSVINFLVGTFQPESVKYTTESFDTAVKNNTNVNLKNFLASDLLKEVDVTKLTKAEIEDYISKYCDTSPELKANQEAISKDVFDSLTSIRESLLNNLDTVIKDTIVSAFVDENRLSPMDPDENLKELLVSDSFYRLYNEFTSPSGLKDRMSRAYNIRQELFNDTIDVNTSTHLFVDLTTLQGKMHAKLIERLQLPTVQKDLANCDSPTKFVNIVFGSQSYKSVTEALQRERDALIRYQNKYFDGFAVFDMETDEAALKRLFGDLGYNYAAIKLNEHGLIPGVSFKVGPDKALEFAISKTKKADLISKIIGKLGYKSTTDIKEALPEDVISRLDNILGGLVYIDDETILNPLGLIYSSLDLTTAELASDYSTRELFDALGKQGKLAGKLKKTLALSNYEVGVRSKKSKTLRHYVLILKAIDTLAELYDDPDFAVSRIILSKEEADAFKDKGLWGIEEDETGPIKNGNHSYIISRKEGLTKDSFKTAAYALLSEGDTTNLNYILPVYSSFVSTNGDVIMHSKDLNYQNTLGYAPVTKVIADLVSHATQEEILQLFSTTDFRNFYKHFGDTDRVLEFFTDTVANIKTKEVPSDLSDNPFYIMMRNSFEASLKVSEMLTDEFNNLHDGFKESSIFKFLGNSTARKTIGKILFENPEASDVELLLKLKQELDKLRSIKIVTEDGQEQKLNPIELKDSKGYVYLEYLDYAKQDEAFYSGSQTSIFRPNNDFSDNDINRLSVDDIALLKDLLKLSKDTATKSYTYEETNPFVKLFQMIHSSEESAKNLDTDKVHIFLDDLYTLSKEDFDTITPLLREALGETNFKLLESKFNLVQEDTDLIYKPESAEGDRLIQLGGNDATLTQYLDAFIKGSIGSSANKSFKNAVDIATKVLEKGRRKPLNYKISDMDSLAHNREVAFIKSLAQMLNLKVLPGINRQGSLLIQNMDITSKLGQFVSSLASMSKLIKAAWTQTDIELNSKTTSGLTEDTYTQIALAMYLYSTGMDYQSEWTKYLFVNLETGKIESTAQAMQGSKSRNDLMYQALHKFKDVESGDAKYMVIDLEKNMFLSDSITSNKLQYGILNSDTLPDWRANLIATAMEQWDNNPFFRNAASSLGLTDTASKVLFVYASTPPQKRAYENIMQDLMEAGVDEDSARLALFNYMEYVQSSKATNSAADQLFQNDLALSLVSLNRLKFNLQQKATSDVMKYNIIYDGVHSDVKTELKEHYKNSQVMYYTPEDSTEPRRIQGSEDVVKALLSGNKEDLGIAISNYKSHKKNPGCSEEQLMNALVYTYLYTSKEASAVSFLLSGNDFDYLLGLRNNIYEHTVNYKGQEIKVDDILNNGNYQGDLESFYSKKADGSNDKTEPFQITITEFDKEGNVVGSKTIYRHVYVDGKLISTEEDIKNYFPAFYNDYYLKNEGTRKAVNEYFHYVKTHSPINIGEEIDSFLIKDMPVVGFNTKGYDNKILKDIGISETSKWFTNSLDAYNDIFKKVLITTELTNKENLVALAKQFGLTTELKTKYNIDIDSAHDAKADTIIAQMVTKHIIDNLLDVNKTRLDMFYDLETLGKGMLGDEFKIESLKDTMQSDDFKLNIESESGKLFVENYNKKFREKDLITKVKAIRKLNTLYNTQEYEINMKRYRSEYNETFNRTQREIINALTESPNNSLKIAIGYILDKQNKPLTQDLLDVIIDNLITIYGNKGNFREREFNNLLASSPEEILTKLNNVKGLIPNFSANEVSNLKTSNHKFSAEEIQSLKQPYENYSVQELEDKHYSFNKPLNEFLEGALIKDSERDILEHIYSESIKYYTDTLKDGTYDIRTAIRKKIFNTLTKQRREFIKEQPVQRIHIDRLYELVQGLPRNSTLDVYDSNGKTVSIKASSDTIYVSAERFKTLTGMDYETARMHFNTQEGEDIYVTAIRHPLDKPDAIQNYKIKVLSTSGKNKKDVILMSPDVLKALHGGDVDGDHINLIRPSKATQEFAKTVLPITKASWSLFDKVIDETGLTYTNKRLNLKRQEEAANFFKRNDVISNDLDNLVNKNANYNELRNQRLNDLKAKYPELKPNELEYLLDVVWINQSSELFKSTNQDNYVYYTYSNKLTKKASDINTKQLRIMYDHKSTLKDINTFADTITGTQQKRFATSVEFNDNVSFKQLDSYFQFAPFSVSGTTLLALKTSLEDSDFKIKFKNALTKFSNDFSLSESHRKSLQKSIDSIENENDVLFTFRLFEDFVRHDNVDTLATGIKTLNEFYSNDSSEDEYELILKKYLSTTQNKDIGFFESMDDLSELKYELLSDISDDDYFSNTSSSQGAIDVLFQRLQQEYSSPNKGGFNPKSYDDFKNKQKANIVYVLNPQEDIAEDSVTLLPGHTAYRNAHLTVIELENDEEIKAVNFKKLTVGDSLTSKRLVSEELKDYIIVGRTNSGIILAKTKGVTGTSKIAIAGSSTTKGTVNTHWNKDLYPKEVQELFKDCFAITRMDEFNRTKTSTDMLNKTKFKYYDVNGKETPDSTKAAYAIAETYIGIAEDTSFWNRDLKNSILDDVTIGTNSKSFEGAVLLHNYFIPKEYLTEEGFTVSNKKIFEMEDLLRRINNPRHQSTNGAYAYKLLLLTSLYKQGILSEKTFTDWVSSKDLISSKGTKVIMDHINSIKDIDKFLATIDNDFESNLYNPDLIAMLLNKDISRYTLEGDTVQSSKKSHGKTLKALVGAQGPRETTSGYLKEVDATRIIKNKDGYEYKTIKDNSDSFIPLLYLRQTLHGDNYGNISSYDAEDMTRRGIVPEAKGYSSGQTDAFHSVDERFVVSYKGESPVNVSSKTGTEAEQTYVVEPTAESMNIRVDSNKLDKYSTLDSNSPYQRKGKSVEDSETHERKITTPNYKDTAKQRLGNWLVTALSTIDKPRDTMTLGYDLFKSPDERDINLQMNARNLNITDDGQLLLKSRDISRIGDVSEWYKAITSEFSHAQTYDTHREAYERIVKSNLDNFDPITGSYKDLPSIKRDRPNSFTFNLKPKDYSDAMVFIHKSSYMPKEYYEGREDYMYSTYQTDLLESGGIKLNSEGAIQAENISKYLRSEGEAITMELNNKFIQLHHIAETRQCLEQLNEYAFLTGTLDRVQRLRASKANQSLIDGVLKTLPYSEAECIEKIKMFEGLYPEIIAPFREVIDSTIALAQRYANLTLEPTSNPFFLLVPNVRIKTEGDKVTERNYRQSMFLNTNLFDSNSNYPTYAGYNFFQSMPQIMRQISKQAAIYNGGRRLKQHGFMKNSSILLKAYEFLHTHKDELEEINIEGKKGEELINVTKSTLRTEFEDFLPYYNTIYNNKVIKSAGSNLLSMYEALRMIISQSEMSSYSEAKQYLDSDDIALKQKAETVVKAYEYSNDILANLCVYSSKGSSLLEAFGRDLFNSGDFALVDTYGRLITPNVTKFKKLSEGSLEYARSIVKYYAGGENNFFKTLALDAINGDVYYMPKDLAEIMDRETFTTRVPKGIQKHLIKLQNTAVKLLMSSPFKLVDRVLKFTGFDLSVLAMANRRTLLKQGKARTELSALWASKGSIINKVDSSTGELIYKDLAEFLYTQGIDPNSTDLTKIIQSESVDLNNKGPLKGYFDMTNKVFSYQNLLERYAFWLATKEDLQRGKGSYGSIYYKKNYVDSLTAIYDETEANNVKVTKEGNQAAFIMAQNIGAPGDFPALAKRLNGFAAFTTFPLASLRWGKGQIFSMGTAFKNLFISGEQGGALKHLAYNGGGIIGIYLVTNLISSLLADMFSIPEEEEEKWKEEQAVPDVFRTLIQGSPVMDTYSSINPVHELGELTINPFVRALTDDDKDTDLIDGFGDWFMTNVVSHANPVVKNVTESVTGYDAIGDNIISTKDEYNIWENFARKAGGYLIGSAGANAMAKYMKSYESEDDTNLEAITTGLSRAVQAELGNTKTYKSNQKNYYKAISLINAYLYAGKDQTYKDDRDFNKAEYSSLKNEISKVIHNKAKMSEIYTIIENYLEDGGTLSEAKSALNNNSIRYKLTRVDTGQDFINSLTDSELACIKSAIAYEDYIFPWLDTIVSDLSEKYNDTSSDYSSTPSVYMNFYPSNLYYNDYNNYSNISTKYPRQAYINTNFRAPNVYYNPNYSLYNPYSNSQQNYSPYDTYEYLMNTWKYGQSIDLYGNKYTGYTNIKGDTWKWNGEK